MDPDPEGAGTDTVEELVDAYVRFFEEQPQLARVYVHVALSAENTTNGARKRFLRHHQRRVERFADAMRRSQPNLSTDESLENAELLLGALDGLAFRWSLDHDFAFAGYASVAAKRLA